jgi:thymidylate kinase
MRQKSLETHLLMHLENSHKGDKILKIAFTGTQGTGKTTSVFDSAKLAKINFPNKSVSGFHDNAARAPKGLYNKKGTAESQLWIFTNQMRTEIELTNTYDIVVCDRTVFDSIAYTIWMGFEYLSNAMFDLAMHHIDSYDEVYFKQIKTNNYLFDCEHRDTKDLEYRQNIENLLMNLYIKAGITNTNKFKIV